jgi:hypothetical protein
MKLAALILTGLAVSSSAAVACRPPCDPPSHHNPPPPSIGVAITEVAPQVDRMGACEVVSGAYVDVTSVQFFAGQFTDSNGVFQNLVPANWEQGVGETCDNPLNQGYHYAGYLVDDGGSVYTQDTSFNVYPLYVK